MGKSGKKTLQKRSRLQPPMKLTSSANEVSFDGHRSLYTECEVGRKARENTFFRKKLQKNLVV